MSIGIKRGETELFRILNATGHRHFDIQIGGLPLTIVAVDGVPMGTYPGAPTSFVVTHFEVPPAGRVEFLVTGTGTPVPLTSNCVLTGPSGDPNPS